LFKLLINAKLMLVCCQQGLKHYNDLRVAVSRSEADELARVVLAEATKLVPGSTVELVGGFRR